MLLSIENYTEAAASSHEDIGKLLLEEYSLKKESMMPAAVADWDVRDLVKTDNPRVLVTRLPDHYRSNKSLPSTFAVLVPHNVPHGTQVSVHAGNAENPSALVRNNTALVSSTLPDGLGRLAKFSDLRFVGRSGRGKYFSVTITVHSEPKLTAVYHNAIKVTVDGPRSSRKLSGGGRVKHYSGSSADLTFSSPESSLCQSPPADQYQPPAYPVSPDSCTSDPPHAIYPGAQASLQSRYHPYLMPPLASVFKNDEPPIGHPQYYPVSGSYPGGGPATVPPPVLQETSVTTRCISYHPQQQYQTTQPAYAPTDLATAAAAGTYPYPETSQTLQQTYYYPNNPAAINNLLMPFDYRNPSPYFHNKLSPFSDAQTCDDDSLISSAGNDPSLFEGDTAAAYTLAGSWGAAAEQQQQQSELDVTACYDSSITLQYPSQAPTASQPSPHQQTSHITQLWRPY